MSWISNTPLANSQIRLKMNVTSWFECDQAVLPKKIYEDINTRREIKEEKFVDVILWAPIKKQRLQMCSREEGDNIVELSERVIPFRYFRFCQRTYKCQTEGDLMSDTQNPLTEVTLWSSQEEAGTKLIIDSLDVTSNEATQSGSMHYPGQKALINVLARGNDTLDSAIRTKMMCASTCPAWYNRETTRSLNCRSWSKQVQSGGLPLIRAALLSAILRAHYYGINFENMNNRKELTIIYQPRLN